MTFGSFPGRYHSPVKGRRVGAIRKGDLVYERFADATADGTDSLNWRGSRGLNWTTVVGTPGFARGYVNLGAAGNTVITAPLDEERISAELDFQFMGLGGSANSQLLMLMSIHTSEDDGWQIRINGGSAVGQANSIVLNVRIGGISNFRVNTTWAFDLQRHRVRVERPFANDTRLFLDDVQLGDQTTSGFATNTKALRLQGITDPALPEIRVFGVRVRRRFD